MRLPNSAKAYIPRTKLTDYLLSETYAVGKAKEQQKMFRELDTVVLARDLEKYSLRKGDVGTIVYSYAEGEAFEVEFVTGEGKTVAVVTLSATDIRPIGDEEILHVRTLMPTADLPA